MFRVVCLFLLIASASAWRKGKGKSGHSCSTGSDTCSSLTTEATCLEPRTAFPSIIGHCIWTGSACVSCVALADGSSCTSQSGCALSNNPFHTCCVRDPYAVCTSTVQADCEAEKFCGWDGSQATDESKCRLCYELDSTACGTASGCEYITFDGEGGCVPSCSGLDETGCEGTPGCGWDGSSSCSNCMSSSLTEAQCGALTGCTWNSDGHCEPSKWAGGNFKNGGWGKNKSKPNKGPKNSSNFIETNTNEDESGPGNGNGKGRFKKSKGKN
eukprot:TRINITY_DN108164_c0_g1_i1.p1 TRINITY_DN108164_c0_g1~~TRINITY_DN108164_c0_g1_i1.p1  ORF type:complete len:271 (-),score=31.93 TRINITY_DN108164_c0_g1_i1:296-1108(-)